MRVKYRNIKETITRALKVERRKGATYPAVRSLLKTINNGRE